MGMADAAAPKGEAVELAAAARPLLWPSAWRVQPAQELLQPLVQSQAAVVEQLQQQAVEEHLVEAARQLHQLLVRQQLDQGQWAEVQRVLLHLAVTLLLDQPVDSPLAQRQQVREEQQRPQQQLHPPEHLLLQGQGQQLLGLIHDGGNLCCMGHRQDWSV